MLDRLEQLNASVASGKFTGRLALAGIDVDGAPHGSVIQAGLSQPFMFLQATTAVNPTRKAVRSKSTFKRFTTVREAPHHSLPVAGSRLHTNIMARSRCYAQWTK